MPWKPPINIPKTSKRRYPTPWRRKVRMIDGRRREVKVRYLRPGREQVRIVGYVNNTDSNRFPNRRGLGYREPGGKGR